MVTVTQKQMAQVLGVSLTRINKLVADGILVKDTSLARGGLRFAESMRRYYCECGEDKDVNYARERALWMKAKRQLAELKLNKTQGQLYESAVVEDAFLRLTTLVRQKLTVLPSKLARTLVGLNADEIYAALTDEVESCLAEMAEYDINELQDEDADED